jgi:hypothetical protein
MIVKQISLTRGMVALVDDEDFDFLSQFSWSAWKTPHHNTWYAVARKEGRNVYMHRLLLDAPPGIEVDHRDGNGLNNQRKNLRYASRSEQMMNTQKMKGKSSKYKGVSWYKRYSKWMARVKKNGKYVFLGYFDDEEAAAQAYDVKARELFGEYARLNLPEKRGG